MDKTKNFSEFDESSIVEACQHCTSTKIDGEIVLLDLEDGIYYGINPTGSKIWEGLDSPTPISELIEDAKDELGLDREKCSEYVTDFLSELREKGLISLS